MIRRSTWILLAVFALALGGTILWTRSRPAAGSGPAADATPTLQPLWSVSANDVLGVRVEDLQAGTVVEVRRGDEQTPWRMVEPEEVPADGSRLEWAITAIVSPRPQGLLAMPDDLEAFGLAEPSRRVTIYLAGNVTRSLEIGRISPAGGVFYVLVPGTDGIVMLSQYSISDVISLVDEIPYALTPTPVLTSPLPTETPAPANETPASAGS